MNLTVSEKKSLLEYFYQFISEKRKDKFDKIIEYRTRYLTIVLEDLFQPQNASAVLRTCDCYGIQDVHIIENRNEYFVNHEVELGASKWLNLKKYNAKKKNTSEALKSLKKNGYRIVATSLRKDVQLLEDLSLDSKIALVFGTEMQGISDETIKYADEFVKIPMYGFTQSFNISVSAAICLSYLSEKIRSSDVKWELGEDERLDVELNWARASIKKCELLENKFFREKNKDLHNYY